MGTSSLESQDRLRREGAVAPRPEWMLGLGCVERRSSLGYERRLSTNLTPKSQDVFSLVNILFILCTLLGLG